MTSGPKTGKICKIQAKTALFDPISQKIFPKFSDKQRTFEKSSISTFWSNGVKQRTKSSIYRSLIWSDHCMLKKLKLVSANVPKICQKSENICQHVSANVPKMGTFANITQILGMFSTLAKFNLYNLKLIFQLDYC